MHRKIQVSKLPLILVLSLICWENGTMSFLRQSHSKGQTKTILYLTFHIQLEIFLTQTLNITTSWWSISCSHLPVPFSSLLCSTSSTRLVNLWRIMLLLSSSVEVLSLFAVLARFWPRLEQEIPSVIISCRSCKMNAKCGWWGNFLWWMKLCLFLPEVGH